MRGLASVVFAALLALPCAGAEAGDDPRGAEDPYVADDAVRLPEPLVFDLVRGLGARRGELEVNVLALFPLGDAGEREVLWAPEVEYAVLDGFALELELPFEGSELEAYKLAGQVTFGTAFRDRYIHGTQFIAEYFDATEVWELTLLYLAGSRFSETWSALAMLGLRAEKGDASGNDREALLNVNVFADVAHRLTVGLETNFAGGKDGGSELLLMPQVHWEVAEHFMIQAGLGGLLTRDETDPTASLRVIYTF